MTVDLPLLGCFGGASSRLIRFVMPPPSGMTASSVMTSH